MNKKISLKNFVIEKVIRTVEEEKTVQNIMAASAEDAIAKASEGADKAYFNSGKRSGEWVVIEGGNARRTISHDEEYTVIEE